MLDKPDPRKRRELAFEALSLEYNSLRSELTAKTTMNSQTVTLIGTAAGVLAALSVKQGLVLLLVGFVVGFIALLTWVVNWQTVEAISAHVAAIEKEINTLVDSWDGEARTPYLNWETQRRKRTWVDKVKLRTPSRSSSLPATKPEK